MRILSNFNFNRYSRFLFFILAVELIAGGGGRLTAFGPVSLRMVLFAAAMVATIIHFIKGDRMPRHYNVIYFLFLLMLAVATAIGIAHTSERAAIWEDLRPLLYILLLPYVYFSIKDIQTTEIVASLFRNTSVVMAIAFVLCLLLFNTGMIQFLDFYKLVEPTGEFFFRGEITFFYKGFLYLCVGFIFLQQHHSRKLYLAIVLVAIVLTVTRGLWLALLITYGAYLLAYGQRNTKTIVTGVSLILLAIAVGLYGQMVISRVSKGIDREISKSTNETRTYLLGDREHSDKQRMRQLTQVLERVTPSSAIIGHGFGQGVPVRPVHMEISYLEIFHKQGLYGLLTWLVVFLWGYRAFTQVARNPAAVPFFLAFVFVFVESLSNQFINNPIGLFLIMVCIVSLERMSIKNTSIGKKSPSIEFSSLHL